MKATTSYLSSYEDRRAVGRVVHLAGYCLPEGSEERWVEVAALRHFMRSANDPMRLDRVELLAVTLMSMRERLAGDADNPLWSEHRFMVDIRRSQAKQVQECLESVAWPGEIEIAIREKAGS